MRRNHELAVRARDILCAKLGIKKPCDERFLGSFFTLPIGALCFDEEAEKKPPLLRFYDHMEERYGFGAYAIEFEGQFLLRVSCHLYNDEKDYEMLADAVAEVVRDFGARAPFCKTLKPIQA